MTFSPPLDRHSLAIVSIVGSSLDVLGSLYLAYDLLGGEHGPLRTLTKAVTYGLLYGAGYGTPLGVFFGLATGVTHGITLAWELSRAARHEPKPSWGYEIAMSAIRGLGFGAGAAFLFGPVFGLVFGLLSALGQSLAYRAGISPSRDYAQGARLRATRLQLLAALNRAVGYTIAAYIAARVGGLHDRALSLGMETGLIVGVVTVVCGAATPLIEWTAERMPSRRMGLIGVALIVVGFALQSVQYWLALFDVAVQ